MAMKFLIVTSCAFLFLCACNGSITVKKDSKEKELIIKQYFDVFNAHNWAKLSLFYTDTASFKDPTLGLGIVKQTRAQFEAKYVALQKMIPDVKDSIVAMYSTNENTVVVEFISKGTAPDNSKMELPICTIFTFDKNLISKDFTYFDNF
jgi:predicted SnoaL-like aldol condensation-catalyzing enzyme